MQIMNLVDVRTKNFCTFIYMALWVKWVKCVFTIEY
jgi:hypothetical protein